MNMEAITHHLNNGGTIIIASHTKPIAITKKIADKFRNAGYEVLKQDADGRGFRLQHGKSSVYVFASHILLR
jgi:hypothetical protein